jgi:hypothetical protein
MCLDVLDVRIVLELVRGFQDRGSQAVDDADDQVETDYEDKGSASLAP